MTGSFPGTKVTASDVVAERGGFEPPDPEKRSTVFETAPIDRSGTSPARTLAHANRGERTAEGEASNAAAELAEPTKLLHEEGDSGKRRPL